MAASLISAALFSAAFFSLGVQLPRSGIDGGVGLRMRDAVEVAAQDLRAQGVKVKIAGAEGARPVQNPHQDEGSDNDDDVAAAPGEIAALAASGVHVIVGPLRSNVAAFEQSALARSRSVAVSATARMPSEVGSRVFKLSPSDRQLAAAAEAWMRARYGSRVCLIDDGTAKARREVRAFLRAAPRARRATLARPAAMQQCVSQSDGVYAAALAGDPVVCSAATALRAGPERLVRALALRGFDPAEFAQAGTLWRPVAAPILRTKAVLAFAARYHSRAFVRADDDAIRFYAATEIAAAAARATDPVRLLRSAGFSTLIGTLRFTAEGDLRAPAIIMHQLN